MTEFDGRVALVTGGSSGIGLEIARVLAGLGAEIILVARRVDRLENAAQELITLGAQVSTISADLSNPDEVNSTISTATTLAGPIDILVNSAGSANALLPIHEMDMDRWDAEMALNLRAPVALCSALLPAMRARQFGFIVNICSEAGARIIPGMGAYCVSKHALRVFTELIQEENQPFGIKAWSICPGEVDTAMGDSDNGRKELFLTTTEVADVVKFLLLQGNNVKMGPEILIRTTGNPFKGSPREHDGSLPPKDNDQMLLV